MTDTSGFAKLVPGFDFLQGLAKSAGSAMPGMGQWIAPTLDPAEIEKRIEELRTVQFWLDQNSRLLSTTIQALEVQRMTLSTLKTMNVQMEGLRDSLQVRVPDAAAPAEASAAAASATDSATSGPAAAAPGAVDPMRWWNALTQQFTDIATTALKETTRAAAAKTAAPTGAAAVAKAGSKSKTKNGKAAARKKPATR